jgi:hypothetical protein
MARTNLTTTVAAQGAEIAALQGAVADIRGMVAQLLAAKGLAPQAPAREAVTPAPAPQVGDRPLRKTTVDEAGNHTRKARNVALAAWLRENGLPANGPVWEAAKKGVSLANLRKLA